MQLITGVLIAELSNTNTGKTVTANISGPVKLYFYADGTSRGDGAGPALFNFPDGQFLQYPRLFVGTGRIHIAWDAAGNIVAFTLEATTRDLCAELS